MAVGRGRRAAWIELMRLPMAATVGADLLAGAAAAGQGPGLWFLPAFLASAALYTAGMVGNDLIDLPRDREERPERPLPSGRLSPRRAARALGVLLALGLVLPALAFAPPVALAWLFLAVSVAAYDLGPRKRAYWWGPIWLGLCRGLDVLAGGLASGGEHWPGGAPLLVMAALFGLYGAAITFQAEREGEGGRASGVVRLLPALPVLALAAWLPGWHGLGPLALLLLEVLLRLPRGSCPLRARRLTGTWVRGFLLLGAAPVLGSGQVAAAGALVLVWGLCTWALGSGPAS